jgi:predicted GH43/DUF377 family glycosyl hydrolase
MWYTGNSPQDPSKSIDTIFPSTGSVGIALSRDGITWTRSGGVVEGVRGPEAATDVGRCLAPNSDDWWWHDTMHLHAGDCQILSNSSVANNVGVYWMFYSGGNFEVSTLPQGILSNSNDSTEDTREIEGLKLRPGLAMSQDGRNWARIEAEHHTGALFDVGESGEWDELFIAAPQVVAAGPRDLRMYYHSYDAGKKKFLVGVATSVDGFKWDKKGVVFEGGADSDAFDGMGAANKCVVRDIDSKKFFMFYEAVAKNGQRSIGLAISDNGLTGWKRHEEPVLKPNDEVGNAWDGGSVGTPWAVSMAEGKWRLYYSGRPVGNDGAWTGIGVALSQSQSGSSAGGPTFFKRRAVSE